MNAVILLFLTIAPDIVCTQFYNYASVVTPYGSAYGTPQTRLAPGGMGSVRYFGGGYQRPMTQWGGVYGGRPSSPYGGGGGGGEWQPYSGGPYARPSPPVPRPDPYDTYGSRPNRPQPPYTGTSNYGGYGGRPRPSDNGNSENWSFLGSLFGDYSSEPPQNYGEPQVITIDLGALWSAIKPHLINAASENGLWTSTKAPVTTKPTTPRATTHRTTTPAPITQPPTTQPPTTQPPTTQPPRTQPPTTQPPTTQPPTTQPPTTSPTTKTTTTIERTTPEPQTDSSTSQATTTASTTTTTTTARPDVPVLYNYGDTGLQYTVFQCRFYLIDKNAPISSKTDESNRIYLDVQPPNGDEFIMYVNPVNGFPEPGQQLPDGRPLPEINGKPCENDESLKSE